MNDNLLNDNLYLPVNIIDNFNYSKKMIIKSHHKNLGEHKYFQDGSIIEIDNDKFNVKYIDDYHMFDDINIFLTKFKEYLFKESLVNVILSKDSIMLVYNNNINIKFEYNHDHIQLNILMFQLYDLFNIHCKNNKDIFHREVTKAINKYI